MKKLINKHTIFQLCLIGIFCVYAVAEIVYQCINFSFGSIIDIFITILICTTFCVVMYLSMKMSVSAKAKKQKETAAVNLQSLGLENDAQQAPQNIDSSKKPKGGFKWWLHQHFVINIKNTLIGLGILLVFGGAGSAFVWAAGSNIAKLNSSNWVKTVATIEYVTHHTNEDPSLDKPFEVLQYVFLDGEGNKIAADGNADFAGLTLRAGNKVTIYYNINSPKQIKTTSTAIMLYLVGGFFIACSLLAFLSLFDINQTFSRGNVAAMALGGLFAGFGLTFFAGVHAAGGDNLLQLCLGLGCGGYALGCFIIIGCFIMLLGLFGILKTLITKLKRKQTI